MLHSFVISCLIIIVFLSDRGRQKEYWDLEKWQRGVLKLKKCGQSQVLLAVGVILWLLLGFTQMFRIYFSVLYLTVFILLCDQVRQKNIM